MLTKRRLLIAIAVCEAAFVCLDLYLIFTDKDPLG